MTAAMNLQSQIVAKAEGFAATKTLIAVMVPKIVVSREQNAAF